MLRLLLDIIQILTGQKLTFSVLQCSYTYNVLIFSWQVICNDICVDNVISFKMIYGMLYIHYICIDKKIELLLYIGLQTKHMRVEGPLKWTYLG